MALKFRELNLLSAMDAACLFSTGLPLLRCCGVSDVVNVRVVVMELCKATIEIPFRCDRYAEIAATSLAVDSEPTEATQKSFQRVGKNLSIKLDAKDPRSLRGSLNGLLDLLVLVNSTLERFGTGAD